MFTGGKNSEDEFRFFTIITDLYLWFSVYFIAYIIFTNI